MARARKAPKQAAGAPAWMATFGDLMNLLLCFFVLLFAMSSVDEEKFQQVSQSFSQSNSVIEGSISPEQIIGGSLSQVENLDQYFQEEDGSTSDPNSQNSQEQKKQEELKNLQQSEQMSNEIEDYIESSRLTDKVSIDYNSQYVQIALSGALLFDSGQETFKKEAEPVMNKIGDLLSRYKNSIIEIEGHSDNVPINSPKFKNNLYLSAARAITVYQYLTEEKNLKPENLKASGYGATRPIASNTTEEGRAKNRRVEIKIYNKANSVK